MSYYKDLKSDLNEIMKIVFEIGKTNKFNNLDFKRILEIAEVIYEEYEENLHIDIRIFARSKLKEIIELEEMKKWNSIKNKIFCLNTSRII